jgi:hypothetical protein
MKMAEAKRTHRIEVGDEVVMPIGKLRFPSRVIEDRGNLGVNGERVLRIRSFFSEELGHVEREVEEEILLLPDSESATEAPARGRHSGA